MKELVMVVGGLSAGCVTSAALFALIVTIGVVSRLAQKTRTASLMKWYERCFMAGCIMANSFYIFRIQWNGDSIFLLGIFGLFMGIYVGCFISALAEVIQVFPVVFKCLNLKAGTKLFVLGMSVGKVAGGLLNLFYSG